MGIWLRFREIELPKINTGAFRGAFREQRGPSRLSHSACQAERLWRPTAAREIPGDEFPAWSRLRAMQKNQIGTWIFYGACLLSLLFVQGWPATVAGWALGGVLAIHVVEFFVKRDVMAKAGGSMGGHFVQTLLYGLFHWKPLEDAQNRES